MGRSETIGPRTNFLGSLVPKINRPGNTMFLALYMPVIIKYVHVMHNDRDLSMQGHFVSGTIRFGDQESPKIRTGTHCSGTSHHPTQDLNYENIITNSAGRQNHFPVEKICLMQPVIKVTPEKL